MHTIDDDSTSESSEDSAQAAERAKVQKQRKLKPGTKNMQKHSTDMCKCMLIVVKINSNPFPQYHWLKCQIHVIYPSPTTNIDIFMSIVNDRKYC